MFYQELKTAKAAAIGTIMPWGGGLTSIPKGWVMCDGSNVAAVDFPLLTQAIGDTYNNLATNLQGSFPSYTGTIKLPLLTDRALMDVEKDYFINGNAPTGRPHDEDLEAKTLVDPKVGTHESQSLTTIFTDVYTDIVFELPDSDYVGGDIYHGRLRGNTAIPGDGFRTLYVAPRKLGRQHVKRHTHPGSYETISGASSAQPGKGVIPYEDVHYTIRFQITDNISGWNGDSYYFGWTDDVPDEPFDAATQLLMPGISPGTGWDTANMQATAGQYVTYWPQVGMTHPSGFSQGSAGKVMAKVLSEAPPFNLKPNQVAFTPISRKFKNTPQYNNGHLIDSTQPIAWGFGGNSFTPSAGMTNYYETTDSINEVRDTLISHAALNFRADNDPDDYIEPHDHDEIEIEFDGSRLRPASNINVIVNLARQTGLLQNDANKNALQVDFNTTQPSLTCLYIIRAY